MSACCRNSFFYKTEAFTAEHTEGAEDAIEIPIFDLGALCTLGGCGKSLLGYYTPRGGEIIEI